MDSLKATITKEEMGGKMRVWRETTTTSPNGRHLGHCKALFVTTDRSLEDAERVHYQSMQDDIAECYVGLLNYAIKHKYLYERWKQNVNMMIYKEVGNIKIHRLQLIHIYEADFNFFLGHAR